MPKSETITIRQIARSIMNYKILVCALLFGIFAFASANSGVLQKKGEEQKKAANVEELAKLARARRDAVEKAYKAWAKVRDKLRPASFQPPPSEWSYVLSVQWLNAELELAGKHNERVAAYVDHVNRMKDWEKVWELTDQAANSYGFQMIGVCIKEAEYWVARERAKKS